MLEKYLSGKNRIYYIVFRKQPNNSPIKALELSYDLNKQYRRDNSDFTISDNNENVIMFKHLEKILNDSGLTFGDFNTAWGYIEQNYNQR